MLKITIVLALLIGVFCDSNQDSSSYGLIGPASASFGRNLILTGGFDGSLNHNQVWEFPLVEDYSASNQWVESASELPDLFVERAHQTSNVFKDYLFTYGGNSTLLELQQLMDGDEHIYYDGKGPNPLVGHSATVRDQELYIYGGFDIKIQEYTDDLWKASLRDGVLSWELIDSESPAGSRAGHSAILYQESLYIFGGQSDEGFINDVWRFDFMSGLWIRAWTYEDSELAPEGRVGHVGTYWTDETYVIFGGFGASGFLNDMWAFDLQSGVWTRLFEGSHAGFNDSTNTTPYPRAFAAYTVIDSTLVIVGGQVSLPDQAEHFWSPSTRWIDIAATEDFAGDVWSYEFSTGTWTFIKCFNAFKNGDSTQAARCRTNNRPTCQSDCSGHGACIAADTCHCFGEWSGVDCSVNPCATSPFAGYDVDLIDRIVISESILDLAQRLTALKHKLEHIQSTLPEFADFVTVVRTNPAIAVMLNTTASLDGALFAQELEESLIPVMVEFNQVLRFTDHNLPLHYPYEEK